MQRKQQSAPKNFRPAFVESKYFVVKSESTESAVPLFTSQSQMTMLISQLKKKELSVDGIEYRRRLKAQVDTLPGAAAFWFFWTNQNLIPEEWKKYSVHFDGTVFRLKDDQENLRFILCLFWDKKGKVWDWVLIYTRCTMFRKDFTVVYVK